jgi:threonine/homoserine efflux transporter RhtA
MDRDVGWPRLPALAGFVVLDQDLGARDLLAIAMVVVASAWAAGFSHR